MANDHNDKSVSGVLSSVSSQNELFFFSPVTLLRKSCKTFPKLQRGSQEWASTSGWDFYRQIMKHWLIEALISVQPTTSTSTPSPPVCKWVTFRRSPSGSGSRWAGAVMGLEVGLNKYPMDWNLPSQGGYMTAEKKRAQKPKSRVQSSPVSSIKRLK